MSPAVEVRAARKEFARSGLFGGGAVTRAVDGVSFAISPGRVLGIAGESGSGKSTLANLLVGLERPTGGEVRVGGRALGGRPDAEFRRAVQMVFQDPFGSINPRFTIGRTVAEPLLIHGIGDAAERHRHQCRHSDGCRPSIGRPGARPCPRCPTRKPERQRDDAR